MSRTSILAATAVAALAASSLMVTDATACGGFGSNRPQPTTGAHRPDRPGAGELLAIPSCVTMESSKRADVRPVQTTYRWASTRGKAPERAALAISGESVDAVPFKALALAWNADGRWTLRGADTLVVASDDAVSACNAQFGHCKMGASLEAGAYGCVIVVLSATDHHQVFSATGASFNVAASALRDKLKVAGVNGLLQYSVCNRSFSGAWMHPG